MPGRPEYGAGSLVFACPLADPVEDEAIDLVLEFEQPAPSVPGGTTTAWSSLLPRGRTRTSSGTAASARPTPIASARWKAGALGAAHARLVAQAWASRREAARRVVCVTCAATAATAVTAAAPRVVGASPPELAEVLRWRGWASCTPLPAAHPDHQEWVMLGARR